MAAQDDLPAVPPDAFAGWPRDRVLDLEQGRANGHVGDRLVSDGDDVRVWHLRIPPRGRFGFHTHVLNYFWTVLTDGSGRSRFSDGTVKDVTYTAGDTRHLHFAEGEHMTHDLENTGDTDLLFVTVEFKGSPNPPLPL